MRLVCSCCGKKIESERGFFAGNGGSCKYSPEGVHIFTNDSSTYVCCYCGKEGDEFKGSCKYSPSGYHKLINGR